MSDLRANELISALLNRSGLPGVVPAGVLI
jgi:hypothetical protein